MGLIQSEKGPYAKKRLGHRNSGTTAWVHGERTAVDTRGERPWEKPALPAPRSDVPPPETGGGQPLLLEPPGLQQPKYTDTEPPVVTSPAPSSGRSHLPRGFGRGFSNWRTNQNPSCMDDGTDGDQVHQSEPELRG